MGGHAIILIEGLETKKEDYPENWENDFVYQEKIYLEHIGFSFSNSGRNHLFAKKGNNKNSKYANYNRGKIEMSRKVRESKIFEIDLTLDQAYSIIDGYVGAPDVDYAITGWRCSSHALRTLRDLGVYDLNEFSMKYIHAINPGALIRFLEKQEGNE